MNLILKKFQEWTSVEDIHSKRVSVFENVKNIPYKINPGNVVPDEGMVRVLSEKFGSCESKHFLLGYMYEKMNLKVKYCTYKFLWKDLNCVFPDRLKVFSKDLLPEYHLACRIKILNKWVLVDCTWDDGLEPAGFKVNRRWNGLEDTVLAVSPMDEVIHKNIVDQNLFVREKRKNYTLQDNKAFFKFIKEFNDWLKEVRVG